MAFEGFPYIVGWELTLRCNLQCRHCGSSAALPRANELTAAEALALCEQFPNLLVQEVNFTGGEPLLRPDWPQIAEKLRELEIRTKVLTNGLTLTDERLSLIKEVGISGVGVSLDGLAETHDDIRGRPGLFELATSGLQRAIAAELPTTVITTVNALNIDQLPQILQALSQLGVERWQVQPVFPLGRSRAAADLQLSRQQYMQLGTFVKEWTPKARNLGIALAPGDSYGYFTTLDERQPPFRGCPAGIVSCGITSDGRIKGCLSLPDEIVEGDLRQHDFWDIWFDPESFEYTRGFTAEQLGGMCRDCEHGEQCRGGCSAMSFGSSGAFHADPFCFSAIQRQEADSLKQSAS